MEDHISIKREINDEMAIDSPPAYSHMSQQFLKPPHMMGAPSSSHLKADFFADIGGIPFTVHLKPVGQYLENDPIVPPKNPKPPARNIPPPTFSCVPASVIQDPKDPTRVVGERTTTSYVSDLYEYIQGHCPNHPVEKFTFGEPHQQQFTVSLQLKGFPIPIEPDYDRKGDDTKDTPKLFPSKKAAKEFVANIALQKLKEIPVQPEHIVVGPGKTKGESPMGELNRYCSQNALPRPHVLDTSNSKPPYFFGCQITIDINGERIFGNGIPQHQNKASARNKAAEEALRWIAEENPKIIKMKGKSGKSGRVLAPGSVVQIDTTDKTIGEIATEACALLGFKAPQRKLEPVEGKPGMYNVYVTLDHGDQETNVGPLKNIFGQKTASKEAMRVTFLTVQYLAQKQYGIKVELIGDSDFELRA
ncbi:hypothetical protein TWF225_011586 [Orbilia oligospora]|uniref:DRBM domain-containing protein n=1 Tax=Orbilia oligospora TaxID=2813651 RepID=A0A7C8J0V0_ORBOL|nr:hypothetical protein TWF102_003533 [Orbilia oligospora]KAF3096019.1 hypothetical protein TWF103_009931 [Orbilia oligospora]KAF3131993.1 hypothetical protein TWF594_009696 [Orbilia oligospora]KAF3192781.1 hypothetical protein TWF225_011586 [Orbilia oligospora]KAF3238330.1 hypothetical protein TWF128_000661 [Orbilia oligospora]